MEDTIRPPSLPDMRVLDRDAFTVRQPILSVRVDTGRMSKIRTHPAIRPWLMDMPRTKLVLDDPEGTSTKLIRLKVKNKGRSRSTIYD